MKNTILTIVILSFLTNGSQAQNNTVSNITKKQFSKFEVVNFQIEDEVFVLSNGLKPNTVIEYYSKPEGGKVVGAEASTAQGTFLKSFSINETVGLVLNNARVSYLLDKEFIVKNIKVVKEENSILFSFYALANEENIELNILKSQNGKDFKTIKTIQLLVGQNEESINFTDEYSPVAIYKIEITKNKTIQRYLSKTYHFNHVSENFKLFPSISKDIVHVNFEKMNKEVSYQIINTQGQMQQKGLFTSNFNTIDIHNLASGIYYVVLNINQQLFSTKIIKQ